MPKRTNTFQSLIFLLENQVNTQGFTVTESKMLIDSVTGEKREADIVVEGEVNRTPFVIALECTARSRKSTNEWVDQMVGKYRNLPAHRVILVSKSGFVEGAEEQVQAKDKRFTLLSWKKAIKVDWRKLIDDTKHFPIIHSRPILVNAEPFIFVEDPSNPRLDRIPADPTLYAQDGTPVGTILQCVQLILDSPLLRETLERSLANPLVLHKRLKDSLPNPPAEAEYPFTISADFERGTYLLDQDGIKRLLDKIVISAKFVVKVNVLQLEEGAYKDVPVLFGAAEAFGHKITFSIAKISEELANLAFKVQVKQKRTQRRKRKG